MIVQELHTVPNEILLEHMTNQIKLDDGNYYPENPCGNHIADIFVSTAQGLIGEHPLNLQIVPVTTPEVLELADRVIKTDPRTIKEVNGMPAALSGINPASEERSAVVILVVGDVPQESSLTKKEIVGIRSLTYASHQDIDESYGFTWDEHGNLSQKPYRDFIPGDHRVLMRGWTTLVGEAGGVAIRNNGIAGKLDKATQAAALALKEFAPKILIMGEQMGFLPAAINETLAGYVFNSSGQINKYNIKFPLFEILGFGDLEMTLKKVDAILSGNNEAEKNVLNMKLSLLGVDPAYLNSVINHEFSIAGLLGKGNPNAEKMKLSALKMGAVEKEGMWSGNSAGRWMTGGPIYIGPITN